MTELPEFVGFQKVIRLTRIPSCQGCGCEFPSGNSAQRFCSSVCRYTTWARNNRARLNATVRRYRARRYAADGRWRDEGQKAAALKAWMLELKAGPCADCGNSFPSCCMDFDHKPGETKAHDVGSMFAHHYSRRLIEAEIAKCDLVCANCHRVRTRDRRTGSGKGKVA